jgi:hypothetical protein
VPSNPHAEAHHILVQTIARLDHDPTSAAGLHALGLHLTHVCCEDSVHTRGPARGTSISDTTIQVVSRRQGQHFATSMPALRFPDFADRSVDVPLAAIRLQVGNHRGEPLRTIGLHEYLGDLRSHLGRPDSWAGSATSLLAASDHHVQLRAQACHLPVSRTGLTTFTPVVFNTRARPGAPAELAILATPDGTSATIVDNQRNGIRLGRRPGQHLFHNNNGQRQTFTSPAPGHPALVLIQVPLRQPPPPPDPYANWDILPREPERGTRKVDPIVIDPHTFEGPFIEIAGLTIERDERHPITVTVHFYQPTHEPELHEQALLELAAQLERIYTTKDPNLITTLTTPT